MHSATLRLLMKKWREHLAESEGRVAFAEAWDEFVALELDLAREAGLAGVRDSAHKEFRDLARDDSDEWQTTIEGVELPARMYVGSDEGGTLVPTHVALLDEWAAYYAARETNYERVAGRFFPLRDLNTRIRPFWERHPELPLEDVLRGIR